jgi:UDP-N-acetylmuramate dehydrogenase
MALPEDESPRLFEELCGLLRERGVQIRTETFQTPPDRAGGVCQLKGNSVFLLHSGASKAERFRALLEGVEQLGMAAIGLKGSDLSPALLRRFNQRGQMPWPHKKQAPPLARSSQRTEWGASLGPRTTIGLGGPAFRLIQVSSSAQLTTALSQAEEWEAPLLVLGGGSNLVVSDQGVYGVVLAMGTKGITYQDDGDTVLCEVQAGEVWDDFVKSAVDRGLRGIECLSGIPGSVGATPVQNVGAYGQEVKDTIERVTVLDTVQRRELVVSASECEFAYRDSIFKHVEKGRYVVVDVTFRLHRFGAPALGYRELEAAFHGQAAPNVLDVRTKVLELRRQKSMVYDRADPNHRSCGSFFVNAVVSADSFAEVERQAKSRPPAFPQADGTVKLPAAWLIEQAGFPKGYRDGSVGLSTKHTLCVVAHEGATSSDVVRLGHKIRAGVEGAFGVRLRPEPEFWGFSEFDDGLPSLASLEPQ